MSLKRLTMLVFFAIAGLFVAPQAASALSFEQSSGGPIMIAPPNDEIAGIATADLDGNGNDDVISTGNSKGIYVFLSDNGGEGFTPAVGSPFGTSSPTTNGRYTVYTGQFGGDSAVDLLVATRTFPQSFETYLGDGTGAFAAAPDFSIAIPNFGESVAAPQAGPLRDVNADGWPDLIVGMNNHSFRVALGSSTGQFTWTAGSPVNVPTPTNSSTEYFFGSTAGDWNGDGDQDVAVSGYDLMDNQQNAIYTADGDGTGAFTAAGSAVHTQGTFQFIENLATIDLNGDTFDDLAFSTRNPDEFRTMLGSASGLVPNPAASSSIATGESSFPSTMAVADFTGDGIEDLGGAIWGTGLFAIGQNAGDGNISSATGSPFTFPFVAGDQFRPNQLAGGDFNGDGTADIASASSNYNPATNIARAVEVMINRPVPVVTPLALDFPVTPVEVISDTLLINIKNTGAPSLVIDSITKSGDAPGKFIVDSFDCPPSIPAGDECDLEVEFIPGGVYGTPTANVDIAFGGGAGTTVVPLTGHTPAVANVTPSGGLDFGDVISGYAPGTKTLDITYASVGGDDLVLGMPEIGSFDAADFQILDPAGCSIPIPPGSSCTMSVTFAPAASSSGFREASFDFATSNAPDLDPVPLGGYARKAEYNLTPGSFDFGDAEIGDNISRVEQVFTVNSTGEGAVAYSGASITGPDADSFSIIRPFTCTPVLAPYDGTCSITVEFHPTGGSAGPRSATLEVDAFSSVTPGPATAALSGTATNGPPPEKPEFRLRLKSANKVKRGKVLVVTAVIENLGRNNIKSLAVRATVPKKFARAPKAIRLVNLVPDRPVYRKFRIKVKRTARKGTKLKVKVTGTAGSVKNSRTRTVRIR